MATPVTDAAAASAGSPRRLRVRVDGVVQGVGFRPHVYRLATEASLAGFIRNDERGVLIEVEGSAGELERFLARLSSEAPPLAHVERISEREIVAAGGTTFTIEVSSGEGEARALVSADMATCADCLGELADPGDRRHRYPFTNCTNCGPRFTIVEDVPYDRRLTTMASFEMCEACRAEYEDPRDRRFHAQPNACPECGPRVRLLGSGDRAEVVDEGAGDAVEATARALLAGRIVAVKGLGGYHLACRADDEAAVSTLRSRKHREDKPFAVMAPSLDAARALVELTAPEERLLAGPERPIVVARAREDASVAPSVAPVGPDLGVMLPYSPLHHLLAADTGLPLVMTSGNVSDEPIAFADDDALERLGGIADRFCVHDRPIHVRTDDSVVRSLDPDLREDPLLIRRSRGYAPAALSLPVPAGSPILACGAELKSTFCLAKGSRAWPSHHIGDLKNFETLTSFRQGIEHFQRLFAVAPQVIAHDLHPDYLSTRYALERDEGELIGVQHHHAHLAAVLAEHGEYGPAVGVILDGSGYGPDGTVWGGELLVGDLHGYERAGLLFPVRMPGGDAAAREPWRMACSWLAAAFEGDPVLPKPLAGSVDTGRWESIGELVASGVASPLTTSAGRLFDAVAALLGLRATVNHEGQAASELEGIADPREIAGNGYPMPVLDEGEAPLLLDARETIRAIVADLERGTEPPLIAGRFHGGLASALARACGLVAERRGIDSVVLAGGVFQNRLLLERTWTQLRDAGLRVLVPRLIPPNDGGVAYGQAAIAAAKGSG